jgi:RimJ/RimL family protein N-acetyltransferase
MIRLTPDQVAGLADWFLPERPGPLVGSHLVLTGHGAAWADRWPAPRALLVEAAGNYSMAGDPGALRAADLPPLAGFIEAPGPFVPLLRAACGDLVAWGRVISELPGTAALDLARFAAPADALVRRLAAADEAHLAGLGPATNWVSKTWGGPSGLAASGHAWGAFVGERLASVAGTFFAGAQYEDVGVVTEPGFRGRGLNTACAAALCRDVRVRGHMPSWTTSADNPASLRVAEKLGFVRHRTDRLFVTGVEVPKGGV